MGRLIYQDERFRLSDDNRRQMKALKGQRLGSKFIFVYSIIVHRRDWHTEALWTPKSWAATLLIAKYSLCSLWKDTCKYGTEKKMNIMKKKVNNKSDELTSAAVYEPWHQNKSCLKASKAFHLKCGASRVFVSKFGRIYVPAPVEIITAAESVLSASRSQKA